MTDERLWDLTDRSALMRWCCGQTEAVSMLEALFSASHDADDIIDGDCEPGTEARVMSRVWIGLLGGVVMNPYFQRYSGHLSGAILPGVANWWMSTQLERSEDETWLVYAFVLRETLENVICAVACLEGGADWMLTVRREISVKYHLGGPEREEFRDWVRSERDKRRARAVQARGVA